MSAFFTSLNLLRNTWIKNDSLAFSEVVNETIDLAPLQTLQIHKDQNLCTNMSFHGVQIDTILDQVQTCVDEHPSNLSFFEDMKANIS